MTAVEKLAPHTDVAAACKSLGVPRASLYRQRRRDIPQSTRPPKPPPRKLTTAQRGRVLETLHSPRFVDKAPGEVYATLLDEGTYMCSERTMYRVLGESKEVRITIQSQGPWFFYST
ncbi:MAG: putative transposase, partial [Planctomycetota bacterium]